ncbi:MAG: 30S ribosome-binding factor RbfA [Thermodesulfobacteriota bacterium]
MVSTRSKRVGDRIREEISDLLLRKVKDPRIGFVTITGVEVSKDLRAAKVFYSILGELEDRQRAADGLASAMGFIKRELGARLQLKFMPEIVFAYDSSMEYADRIERLLMEIRRDDDESN